MSKVAARTLFIATLAAWLCACSTGGGTGTSTASTSAGTSGTAGTGGTGGTGGTSGTGGSGGTSVGTPTDVLTYHNDTMRTGQNLTETVLTPANVNASSFGLLQVLPADSVVDATPLLVSNLTIGGSAHNVIYVASENATVYAYDLNSYTQLAKVSLLPSGETAAATTGGCNQVSPTLGVTSTPVIDRSAGPNGTMFVIAMSQNAAGTTVHRLHALDLTTLADRMPPVTIQASYPGGGGTLTFNPRQYKERAALLLSGGQIYTAWASNCDIPPYNAWVMAYSESSLAQTQVLNLTPNGNAGAIWNAGGVIADSSGSLYVLLGNGTFDGTADYGNALVRLTTNGSALSVADYFTPLNTVTDSLQDIDFGSGSPMIIPDQTDAAGTTHQLVFAAGKDATAFLLDRTNLGKFNASINQVFQQLLGILGGGVWSAPAYYNGSIYLAGVGAPLDAFALSNAMMPSSPSSQSAVSFGYPGASPAVSANGSTNGIVWAVQNLNPAVLHAYNPANLGVEYYNSAQAANGRDNFGNGNKFVTPVIVDGRVLVGTPTGVAVFGLL
jgi:hypothetical protein